MTIEDIKKPENIIYKKTPLLTDTVMHYCPGCSHGTVHKLIAEVIEEMGIQQDTIAVSPVGFTPGSSTRMRPLFPSFWMLGCVTPKRSIRFLNTLNEFAIALSASLLITSMTCASEDSGPILPTMSKVPNTCASGMPFEDFSSVPRPQPSLFSWRTHSR